MTNCIVTNTISKLYDAVSASIVVTRDALAERLTSVRETSSLLYNKMMGNIEYGREILKDIKAIVEQILASEEKNESKKAGL